MTNEETAVKINGHDHEIGSLKHRVENLETQAKVIQELCLNVEKLTLSIEQMVKEQARQGNRLEKLEQEPGNNWQLAKKTALTAIVSVIAGALAAAAIIAIAKNI